VDIYLLAELHYRFNHQSHILEELHRESRCWPHLRVRCLSRGGPGGHCWYPTHRVPLHTSFKSRQGVGHASTRSYAAHSARLRPPCLGGLQRSRVSYGSGPHLPAQEGSGVTMHPAAPDLTQPQWWALVLPCVTQFQTPPLYMGGGAPLLTRVAWPSMDCGLRE
jgi:hypothetical protein